MVMLGLVTYLSFFTTITNSFFHSFFLLILGVFFFFLLYFPPLSSFCSKASLYFLGCGLND